MHIKLQPHLTQHHEITHTQTITHDKNDIENNFERKRWSLTTTPNLIEVVPNQIKQINIVLRS